LYPDEIDYALSSSSSSDSIVVSSFKDNDTSVTIPSTILVNNVSYNVEADFSNLFSDTLKKSIKEITVSGVKVKNNSLANAFNGFSNLSSIDLSDFDTSQVTNMDGMFANCEKLKTIDMTNISTKNVEFEVTDEGKYYNSMFSVSGRSTDTKNKILVLTEDEKLLNYDYKQDNRCETTIAVNEILSSNTATSATSKSIKIYAINPNGSNSYYENLLQEAGYFISEDKIIESIEFKQDANDVTKSILEIKYSVGEIPLQSIPDEEIVEDTSSKKDIIGTIISSTTNMIDTVANKLNPSEIFKDIEFCLEKDKIIEFFNKGYINGYEEADGSYSFRPEQNMTRAEFVKVANKVFNFTEKAECNFIDVSPDDWFYDDVLIAVKADYINGYENNTFKPNANITREEIAVVISRVKNLTSSRNIILADALEASLWAIDSIELVYGAGIIDGYEDNTFRPKENAQRQHVVKMLYNASKN
jgi:surface protein